MPLKLILVSHVLCPYVQRAVIALKEKNIAFERIDIDLANKPDWFLKVSPLGKTPLLLVDEQPIFESAVICEYLEDTQPQPLHPSDPLQRARHRSWIEFASAILNVIGAFYGAPNSIAMKAKAFDLQAKFQQLETELESSGHEGPYFNGVAFSLVDAAFGPVFRYFDVFDTIGDFDVFSKTPRVNRWRVALQQRASVSSAVRSDYHQLLREFLFNRHSELSRVMAQQVSITV